MGAEVLANNDVPRGTLYVEKLSKGWVLPFPPILSRSSLILRAMFLSSLLFSNASNIDYTEVRKLSSEGYKVKQREVIVLNSTFKSRCLSSKLGHPRIKWPY